MPHLARAIPVLGGAKLRDRIRATVVRVTRSLGDQHTAAIRSAFQQPVPKPELAPVPPFWFGV